MFAPLAQRHNMIHGEPRLSSAIETEPALRLPDCFPLDASNAPAIALPTAPPRLGRPYCHNAGGAFAIDPLIFSLVCPCYGRRLASRLLGSRPRRLPVSKPAFLRPGQLPINFLVGPLVLPLALRAAVDARAGAIRSGDIIFSAPPASSSHCCIMPGLLECLYVTILVLCGLRTAIVLPLLSVSASPCTYPPRPSWYTSARIESRIGRRSSTTGCTHTATLRQVTACEDQEDYTDVRCSSSVFFHRSYCAVKAGLFAAFA